MGQQQKEDREIENPKEAEKRSQENSKLEEMLKARGLSWQEFQVLRDVIHPNASSPLSVIMAFDYCKARKLDPFKRVVHIVPIYSKKKGGYVDSVWPGIAEIRITAFRTGCYAGHSPYVYGRTVDQTFTWKDQKGNQVSREISYPEWVEKTVYRLVDGIKCEFPGPRVFWMEARAEREYGSDVPNDMWLNAPYQQIQKCCDAAALRATFPEECGEYTAEEMEGKAVDIYAESSSEEIDMEPPALLEVPITTSVSVRSGPLDSAQTGFLTAPAKPASKVVQQSVWG